jgi:UDP-glucose 6-dehydrogenase
MRPDRIVLGVEDERAIELMRRLYAPSSVIMTAFC